MDDQTQSGSCESSLAPHRPCMSCVSLFSFFWYICINHHGLWRATQPMGGPTDQTPLLGGRKNDSRTATIQDDDSVLKGRDDGEVHPHGLYALPCQRCALAVCCVGEREREKRERHFCVMRKKKISSLFVMSRPHFRYSRLFRGAPLAVEPSVIALSCIRGMDWRWGSGVTALWSFRIAKTELCAFLPFV